jgi:cytochrome c peroxidase
MAVAADGTTVVAADPDRDRVYIIDIRAPSRVRTIPLMAHDEPGRVVIDGSTRAFVALRHGGSVVTIDLSTASVEARRDVCTAPRGVAYDAASDVLHVACAAGELVTVPAGGGDEIRRVQITRDLRDVVVTPTGLALTTFRDAKILLIDNGADAAVEQSPATSPKLGVPRVAWRAIWAPPVAGGEAGLVIAAQKAPDPNDATPPAAPAEYYDSSGDCSNSGPGPVVNDGNASIHIPDAVLPVDVAATGQRLALVGAGNAHIPYEPQLFFLERSTPSPSHTFPCVVGDGVSLSNVQLTSVAFARSGAVVAALSREPAALVLIDATSKLEVSRIPLSDESREDTGHSIFHSNSGAGLACASCHPEGRDDGYAWRSLDLGARRTPSLLGTLANTAPYHWNGEAKDMSALMKLTFESRMRGPALSEEQVQAVDGWLRALPAPPPAKVSDNDAVARGKALFEGAAGCATCHSGVMRTNNASIDVKTGGTFQVPSLVGVAWRPPYFHDGSAPTLAAVLARGHNAVPLDSGQASDIAAYLETF